MTAPTHPGDRPSLRTFVSALAVTGVLSALAVCAAVAVAPGAARTPLAGGGAVAAVVLSAAVATAAHARRTARDTRQRLEGVTQDVGRLLQQQARTTEEAHREQQRLVDELARQRAELTESFTAERDRLVAEGTRELDRLRQENARLADELEQARRERSAAISATSNAAARMQALATATLADLRAMEERHTDEDVLHDLLHLDHRTAQAGRLADSIAVLTGARSGRRWARPISMESILRGAMGRIAGYRRVRVHSTSEAAVAGHAAEGVMHALAELLDNAANFSPPTAEVHVYVEEVPAGAIVSVEDSGLVMGDVQLRRAERAVAGDVSGLGGLTGTRLGLAVVGRLSRKHGLKVSFRPSARGGTGVLMLIPQSILTGPAPAEPAAAAPPAQSVTTPRNATPAQSVTPVPPPPALEAAPVHESAAPAEPGPAGLPKRRRGRTLAEAERARSASDSGPRSAPTAEEGKARAARFSSFRQAVRPSAPSGPRPAPAAGPSEEGPPARSTDPSGLSGPSDAPTPDGPAAVTPANPDDRAAVAGPTDDSRTDTGEHGSYGTGDRGSPAPSHPHTPSHSHTHSHSHSHPEGDTTS
ncbi:MULTISPECIES: ATP-binding protein [Streptomyces]|uniref:ATP-binding protein n=1 Tax=Streptomyces TaxID=1883 RepID=UPI00167A7C8D|nr:MULTISPECIES: ATP-binding protein [Streptomyces]MBK3522938.1 histidine kinase [Streptomyces sp. MBT70]GGR76699.1 histidine kinase [Streptomyces eurythermus]